MSHATQTPSTPCLLLHRTVLERNLSRVSTIATEAGVALRPHCKTAKSAEIARRATAGFNGAITVATLNEAEYFADHGFTDITYAICIVPSKLDRIVALQERGVNISIITDNLGVAAKVAERSANVSSPLPVLIEIDTGTKRTGLLPDSPDLIPLATLLHECPTLELRGVLSFGGFGYLEETPAKIAVAAEQERVRILEAADRMRQAGIPCPVVSVGSTPNVLCAQSFEGVTEIRPGVYVFGDLMMNALGVYDYEDIAVTVQASVIGHNRDQNRIYIDAGALALSQDQGFDRAGLPYAKYGLIRHADNARPYAGIGVCNVNQEHGFVACLDHTDPFPFDDFPVGSTLRVIPNHACHSIEGFDRYHVIDDAGEIVDEWARTNGW